MIVDDRVPTAYCADCGTIVFRRTLEEHECPMRKDGPKSNQELRAARLLLATAIARLVLFLAALGAGIFLLAWVQS